MSTSKTCFEPKKKAEMEWTAFVFGSGKKNGGEKIRTPDFNHAKVTLYQLSYRTVESYFMVQKRAEGKREKSEKSEI